MQSQTAPLDMASDANELLQRQLQQLQHSHEGFMRAVSHDLRAPLRHLTSFAPLLRESVEALAQQSHGSEAAQEALEFLGTMEQSARKMGLMLDGMLMLSRAARQPLNLQAVDVCQVIRSCSQRTLARLPVEQWLLPHEGARLQADPVALHSVVQVLLDNAVKFSARHPQPQVQVAVMPISQQGWRVAITDNGVGFDTTRMSTAWPPFQRMHRDADFEGIGCGLAHAHILLQRHGARLQLVSSPGAGCTASFDWPAA